MNSERMLKESRYLRGRKITKVRMSETHICLHFEDGAFCVFEALQVLKDPPYVSLCAEYGDLDLKDLWGLEVITDEEYTEKQAAYLQKVAECREFLDEYESA